MFLAGAEGLELPLRNMVAYHPWSGCYAPCFFPSGARLSLPPAAAYSFAPARSACLELKFYRKQKQNTGLLTGALLLAGAEGLEPSARGFGER